MPGPKPFRSSQRGHYSENSPKRPATPYRLDHSSDVRTKVGEKRPQHSQSASDAKKSRVEERPKTMISRDKGYFTNGALKTVRDLQAQDISWKLACALRKNPNPTQHHWVIAETHDQAQKDLGELLKSRPTYVGVDFEFTHLMEEHRREAYYYPAKTTKDRCNVIRMVQLCCGGSNKVWILDVSAIAADFRQASRSVQNQRKSAPDWQKPMPEAFFEILASTEVTKVGFAIQQDQRALQSTFGVKMENVVGLEISWKECVAEMQLSQIHKGEVPGLKIMIEQLFDVEHGKEVRENLWETLRKQVQISDEICKYAAADAYYTTLAYGVLSELKTRMTSAASDTTCSKLLISDSIMATVQVHTATTRKISLSGAKICDGVQYLETIPDLLKYKTIIFSLGVNDLLNKPEIWCSNSIEDAETKIRDHLIKAYSDFWNLLKNLEENIEIILLNPMKVSKEFVNQNFPFQWQRTETDSVWANMLIGKFKDVIKECLDSSIDVSDVNVDLIACHLATVNSEGLQAPDGLHIADEKLIQFTNVLNEIFSNESPPMFAAIAGDGYNRGTSHRRKNWESIVRKTATSHTTNSVGLFAMQVESRTSDNDVILVEQSEQGSSSSIGKNAESQRSVIMTVPTMDGIDDSGWHDPTTSFDGGPLLVVDASQHEERKITEDSSSDVHIHSGLPESVIRRIEQLEKRIAALEKNETVRIQITNFKPSEEVEITPRWFKPATNPSEKAVQLMGINADYLRSPNIILQITRFLHRLLDKGGLTIQWVSNFSQMSKLHVVTMLEKSQFDHLDPCEKVLILEAIMSDFNSYLQGRNYLKNRQLKDGTYEEFHRSAMLYEFEYRRLYRQDEAVLAVIA